MISQSEVIRVVVCEQRLLSQNALVETGREACGDTRPCGAWIWNDRAAAPSIAPDNHDGLSQAHITAARAVWIAEQSNLIEISKVD